tara:strand:- start:695 stop:1348 length:654 start_codon:yes stop_codon:yes gene_type:complete
MKLFLDSANVDEIKEATSMGVISGITTNPSLAAKEGIHAMDSYKSTVKKIADLVDGPISVEVVSTDLDGIIKEGKDIATWIDNVWVKIPSTKTGFKAISILSNQGININQTLCFSVNQALLGAHAGSTVVSPFIGRFDDGGQTGMDLIGDLSSIFKNYGYKTKVMAASIRHPLHCVQAAKNGADIATIPFDVLEKMAAHVLTDSGMRKFLDDWEQKS